MNYKELKKKFEENQDPKRAAQMKRYMRNKFDFYGYQSVARKAVYHQDLLLEKHQHTIDSTAPVTFTVTKSPVTRISPV